MLPQTPLGFGLIGCGRIGERHARLLHDGAVAGARLAAVCDADAARARQFGARFAVPHYVDPHAMMNAEAARLDALSICTPTGNHAPMTVAMAPYRRHIVVEKPMALTLDHADAMIQACRLHQVKLFVVKQNRFNRPVALMRRAFDEGRFGRITMGSVRVWWKRDQAYYDRDGWRGTWALDGGVFANQASHHVDLLEWFLGEPERVYAVGRTALVDIETEDTGVAVIEFRSGAIGVVQATTAARPVDLEGSLALLGEGGTVEIGGFAVNEIRTWRFAEPRADDAEVIAAGRTNPPDVYGFGHAAYLADVVQAIRDDRPGLVDGIEGRKSLELIAAVYESIATGGAVDLRFRQRRSPLGLAAR